MEGKIGRQDERDVDIDVLRRISAESMKRGTSGDVIRSTLVKIGLNRKEADAIVKQVKKELKKK
jgi:monoamine oxidase